MIVSPARPEDSFRSDQISRKQTSLCVDGAARRVPGFKPTNPGPTPTVGLINFQSDLVNQPMRI